MSQLTNLVTMHHIPGVDTPVDIKATDTPGSGGAYHRYEIDGINLLLNQSGKGEEQTVILFQNGPIPQNGVNGVTMEHLLAIAGHRLACFQAGPFASPDNQEALEHIEKAITALNRRTISRISRGVEGKEVA